MKRIGLLLLLILPGHLLSGQAVLSPVYFSHVTLWVDPATYQAVRDSDFLKNHFSALETRTTETERGIVPTYTGTYLYGKRTYLEFMVAGSVPSQPTRVGELGLAMWVDDVQCLPAITDSLVARTQASAEGGTRTLTVNGRTIRWFEFVSPLFPEQRELTADAWVLANYPTYLGSDTQIYGLTRRVRHGKKRSSFPTSPSECSKMSRVSRWCLRKTRSSG
jgi:hypothetical protein